LLTSPHALTPKPSSKAVVIFGNGGIASLAWYCLTHDSPHKVLAFTLNQDYLHQSITGDPTHEGLPLVPFEQLASMYPAEQVSLLLALGNREINGLRRARYDQAKAMGYSLLTYVSSRAITWPDLRTGDNCMVYEQTVIQPFATIGNNVIIRSSVHVSHHCEIGNHCYIAPGVTLSGNVKLGEQVFLGVGSVVRDGVTLADRTFVGAGSVVVADTEPGCAYVGNPARKIAKSSFDITTT
jgi:sugar O-acyltransferase (sialic acid O-acetyltransferase NeuD family)